MSSCTRTATASDRPQGPAPLLPDDRRRATLAVIGLVAGGVLLVGCSSSGSSAAPSSSGTGAAAPSTAASGASPGTASPSASSGAATTGSVAAAAPLAQAETSDDGIPLRIALTEVRVDGQLMNVSVTATNIGGADSKKWQVSQFFWNGIYDAEGSLSTVDSFSADGIYVLDATNAKRYLVARNAQKLCVCTGALAGTFATPGQSITVTATFKAPPSDVGTVTVAVPHVNAFSGIKVQR